MEQELCLLFSHPLSHHALEWNSAAKIDMLAWFNYSPLLRYPLHHNHNGCDTLLEDHVCHQAVMTTITNFLCDHEGKSISLTFKWEALKAVFGCFSSNIGPNSKKNEQETSPKPSKTTILRDLTKTVIVTGHLCRNLCC